MCLNYIEMLNFDKKSQNPSKISQNRLKMVKNDQNPIKIDHFRWISLFLLELNQQSLSQHYNQFLIKKIKKYPILTFLVKNWLILIKICSKLREN